MEKNNWKLKDIDLYITNTKKWFEEGLLSKVIIENF